MNILSKLNKLKISGALFTLMLLPSAFSLAPPKSASDGGAALTNSPKTITVRFDNQSRKFVSYSTYIKDALNEGSIPFEDGDSTLPYMDDPVTDNLSIEVFRAKPITVIDGEKVIHSTSGFSDPRLALRQLGIEVLEKDIVNMDIHAANFRNTDRIGYVIDFVKAPRVQILADGKKNKVATWDITVEDVLNNNGVTLDGKDYVVPSLTSTISDNMKIKVIRVGEKKKTFRSTTNFTTVLSYDSNLGFFESKVKQTGRQGVFDKIFKYRFEDGKLLWKKLFKTKIVQSLRNHVVARGARFGDRATFYCLPPYEDHCNGYTAAKGAGLYDVPYGSILRVTNNTIGSPYYNKSVDVKINDYCPCPSGAMIDLSEAAFMRISDRIRPMPKVKVQLLSSP